LTELCGIGQMLEGKIWARVASIRRFASAAAFASYTGNAPIAVSSGDVVVPGRGTASSTMRCALSDVVYRRLVRDAGAAGPGGHAGATLQSSAAGPTPTADSSDKSLPGPTVAQPTTVGK
jgi:transposase